MRLENLCLLYAGVLSESGAPKADVLTWIDSIRGRASLEGVEESWDTYAGSKEYGTVGSRHEVIQQE